MSSVDHRLAWILSGMERMMGWVMLCLGLILRVDGADHLVDEAMIEADLVGEVVTGGDLGVEAVMIEDEGARETARASRLEH